MAKIVLGLGTSHGPMLSTPADKWDSRVPFDRSNRDHHFRGRVYSFDDLVALRKDEDLAAQITPEKWRERHAACRAALARMQAIFAKVKPDVAVIVGNDQKEIFTEANMPAFMVYRGETLRNGPYPPEIESKLGPGVAQAAIGHLPPEWTTYPCAPGLADHIVRSVMAENFDVSVSKELPSGPRGNHVPHAFGFVYRQIMADKVIPHVPVYVNTFYPPNQPSAKRCFDFGEALARAVESWPEHLRVALICSGGLSHFVIDEELDQRVISGLRDRDFSALTSIPESYFQAGTSELKNWIPVAGAMARANLPMELVDYVPCYRSLAGTGNAMGFVAWR
jgi:hypothetical protein